MQVSLVFSSSPHPFAVCRGSSLLTFAVTIQGNTSRPNTAPWMMILVFAGEARERPGHEKPGRRADEPLVVIGLIRNDLDYFLRVNQFTALVVGGGFLMDVKHGLLVERYRMEV